MPPLLPLDRARRLARDVVGYAVDALDLVDDPDRDAPKEIVAIRVTDYLYSPSYFTSGTSLKISKLSP